MRSRVRIPAMTRRIALCVFFVWIRMFIALGAVDQDDVNCLAGVKGLIVQDPDNKLKSWTKKQIQIPCNGTFSELDGVTCNNERVYKLTLGGFGVYGKLSPSISNCTNLQSLDLSGNHFGGEIPTEIQALVNLAVLNLSTNELTGTIPPQLTVCAYLNVIDLHNNKLTGPIPPQLGLLARLSAFDVSHNDLQGMIPTTLVNRSANLPRFNASSFVGNKGLFGYPLPPLKNRGLSVIAIVGIGLGSGLLSLVVSFTAVCIWLRVTEQGLAAEEGKITQLMPEY